MAIHFAGWGIGGWLLLFFVVVPTIRWSLWGASWGTRYGLRYSKRWGRHHAKRWGGSDFDDDTQTEAGLKEIEALRADLDSRLGEVDALHSRVAELENRLDFTERLLAQRSQTLPLTERSGSGQPG